MKNRKHIRSQRFRKKNGGWPVGGCASHAQRSAGAGPGSQGPKNIKIGCSTLAWNVSPNSIDNFEMALKDISELGYWSFETVSAMIEALDKDWTLARLIEKYQLPMKAGYIEVNVTDPSVRKANIEKVIRITKLVKKHGGNYVVISINGRRPPAVTGRGPQGPTPSISRNTKRTWSPL